MKLKQAHNKARGIAEASFSASQAEDLKDRIAKLEEQVKMLQRVIKHIGIITPANERRIMEKFGMQAEDDKNTESRQKRVH